MYQVVKYSSEKENEWDDFVMDQAVNGTFLQTRRFLNYHPVGRFTDASVMIYDKGKLVAVCPACQMIEDGKKIFFSHKGTTFGGLIFNPKYYCAEKVLKAINELEMYLEREGYQKLELKITPDLFAKESGSLLEYCLYNYGYDSYIDLSSYVDLAETSDIIIDSFDRNKKRNIEKCKAHNLYFRELKNEQEIEGFYRLLTKNLEKYKHRPIHTVEEIKEFRKARLKDETKFYGVFRENEQVAGGMMFLFRQTNVIHAQNLSADYTFTEYSPITYLYYKVIEKAKLEGFAKLSWGISTEDQGKTLNQTLLRNKESYGSKYSINRTFYKELGR